MRTASKSFAKAANKKWTVLRLILLITVGLGLFWGFFTAWRSLVLLSKSQQISQKSRQFSRDFFVGTASNPLITYVVMGDSTAVGLGVNRLQESYPYKVAEALASRGYYVHAINIATSGARLRDALDHQAPQIEILKPQIITLSVGANDATHFTPLQEYRYLSHTLVSMLNDSPAKILVAGTPDMYQTPALPLPYALLANIRARKQNASLKSALDNSRIRYIDLYSRGKLIYRKNKGLYSPDLFHPSAEGYQLWSRLFKEKL